MARGQPHEEETAERKPNGARSVLAETRAHVPLAQNGENDYGA
jgi:hypothetical protein